MRIGIFAIRDITPGEELTYDYQFQHSGLAGAAGAYRRDVASACTSYVYLGCPLALLPAIQSFMLELGWNKAMGHNSAQQSELVVQCPFTYHEDMCCFTCQGTVACGKQAGPAPASTCFPLLCRCMCGAPCCRGTMDTQPERFKDFGKRIEIWWEGDGVFYRGTVLQYHTASGKHTVLYDDGESEKISLGLMRHRWGPRS